METKYTLTIIGSNASRNNYNLNAQTLTEAKRESEQFGTYPGDCLQIWRSDGSVVPVASKCDRHAAKWLNSWQ